MTKILVGIRGLARGEIHWGRFSELMANKKDHARFVTFELAGNGTRAGERSSPDPLVVVTDLRLQLRAYRERHPDLKLSSIHLIGISLGGIICLKWAELFPEEIAQVFLVNSSLRQLSPFYERLRPRNYPRIFAAVLSASPRTRERLILQITSNNLTSSRRNLPVFVEAGTRFPPRKRNFILQIILATRIEIRRKIRPRVTVLVSRTDRLVAARCSARLARFLNCELRAHETAGHDLPLDDPEWLERQITEDLEEIRI